MKEQKLTGDEYDALDHIQRGAKSDRVNACIGRNAKRLTSLKMIQSGRDGKIRLTDKGAEVLFLRRCIAALIALTADPKHPIDSDVAQFLIRKSHIANSGDGFIVTARGRESLADIVNQRSSVLPTG